MEVNVHEKSALTLNLSLSCIATVYEDLGIGFILDPCPGSDLVRAAECGDVAAVNGFLEDGNLRCRNVHLLVRSDFQNLIRCCSLMQVLM